MGGLGFGVQGVNTGSYRFFEGYLNPNSRQNGEVLTFVKDSRF